MRSAIAALVAVAVLVCAGWLLLGWGDVVTGRYQSLNDARKAHVFERGWLPDILPPSSSGIRTSNDLDLNTSDGEFTFATSEYAAFAARLQPYRAMDTPVANFKRKIEQMRTDGFHPAVFEDEISTWIFFCKPEGGHCIYTMWLRRS